MSTSKLGCWIDRWSSRVALRRSAAGYVVGVLGLVACSKHPEARAPEDARAIEASGKLEPASAVERQLLERMETMPSGKPTQIGGQVVVVHEAYPAASGRTCRPVTLNQQAEHGAKTLLACKEQGNDWFIVPEVFAREE